MISSLPVRAERDESEDVLRLYPEESEEESWKEDPGGETDDGADNSCRRVS